MQNSKNSFEKDVYGQELILNLYGCDPKTISSQQEIKKFAVTLCEDVIKMKRVGKPFVFHFGHNNLLTSGYSLVQLIETSSVTAHFSEQKRSAYINIFSCAWFNPKKTAVFCKKFFNASRMTSHIIKRV